MITTKARDPQTRRRPVGATPDETRPEHFRTRFFYDCEFIEDGATIDLLSIGMVCEDGREFYAENMDADHTKASEWVRANVLPLLWDQPNSRMRFTRFINDGGYGGLLTHAGIAEALLQFVDGARSRPEFWGYYADYDHVALCQLFGRMVELPKNFPMFTMDVKQLAVSLGSPPLPSQPLGEHHALADAVWAQSTWEYLNRLNREKK